MSVIFVQIPCFQISMLSLKIKLTFKNKTENKPQLKKTSVKTLLNDFFKNKSYRFFNFYVDTLFLNEYEQFKNKTKNKTKFKKTSVKTLLNDLFKKNLTDFLIFV